MYPKLPPDVQKMFSQVNDTLLGNGPNIRLGHLSELGANPGFPIITVFSEGTLEPLTRGRYRHLTVSVDHWTSAAQAGNADGRRLVSLLYQYSSQTLQDSNFSGNGIAIQRFFESRASDPIFEPATKLYHILTTYTCEAIASVWY